MKPLLLFLLLLFNRSGEPIKVNQLQKDALPKSIRYAGKLVNAVSYRDKNGENIVITTETGITNARGANADGFREAALYGYHYIIEHSVPKMTWQMHDFVEQCPVDLDASYIPGTFAVTDLNNDGLAEVWLMYKTVCHGDVSPSNMKIIMHEGDKKYAMRGTDRVKVSNTEMTGGEYTFDDVFKAGPKVFSIYAEQLWKSNMVEKQK